VCVSSSLPDEKRFHLSGPIASLAPWFRPPLNALFPLTSRPVASLLSIIPPPKEHRCWSENDPDNHPQPPPDPDPFSMRFPCPDSNAPGALSFLQMRCRFFFLPSEIPSVYYFIRVPNHERNTSILVPRLSKLKDHQRLRIMTFAFPNSLEQSLIASHCHFILLFYGRRVSVVCNPPGFIRDFLLLPYFAPRSQSPDLGAVF